MIGNDYDGNAVLTRDELAAAAESSGLGNGAEGIPPSTMECLRDVAPSCLETPDGSEISPSMAMRLIMQPFNIRMPSTCYCCPEYYNQLQNAGRVPAGVECPGV